jgi:hypothetical protein
MMNETNYTYSDELVSDLHKDAYGFRPQLYFWEGWAAMTPDQKQVEWDRLVDLMTERDQEEQERQARAMLDAELELTRIMETVPGSTRADAVRFLADAEGCVHKNGFADLEELCYNLDLPFHYFKALNKEVNPR